MAQEGRDDKGKFTIRNMYHLMRERVGCPLKFDNPESLAEKAVEYFEWSDECTSNYIDFTITPLSGTFFHSTTDEAGDIEITEEYTAFLQDKLKEYRNNTLWLSEEIQEKMEDLDMNEQDWSYYGI